MRKITRYFNARNFVILVIVAFVVIMIVFGWVDKMNREAFEEKKQKVKDNPIAAYDTGKDIDLSDCFKYCDWKEKKIDRIVLGVDADGEGINKYYIDDEAVVKNVLDVLNDVTFNVGNDSLYQKRKDNVWSVQLIAGDEEYSIKLKGYVSGYDDVEITYIGTRYPDYDVSAHDSFPFMSNIAGSNQLIYGEDVYNSILQIYNDEVDEISIDVIKRLKKENSHEVTDYFRYVHTRTNVRNFTDDDGIYRAALTYKFPIENTKCYMEVEKHNEGSIGGAPATHDIIRVEIFNESGEVIDMFECTDEELDAFLNK